MRYIRNKAPSAAFWAALRRSAGFLLVIAVLALASNSFTSHAGHEATPPGYYVDKVVLRVVGDPGEAARAIVEGRLHVYITPVSYQDYARLSKSSAALGFVAVDLSHIYVVVNPEREDYLNLKRTLISAIDAAKISREVFGGFGKELLIPVPAGNPLRAMFLDVLGGLRAAGGGRTSADGVRDPLVVASPRDEVLSAVAESIVSQLRASGVRADRVQLGDLVAAKWDLAVFRVSVWGAGDFIERMRKISEAEPLRSLAGSSEALSGYLSCLDRIHGLQYSDLLTALRECLEAYARSPLIALLTEPGFQLYDKDVLEAFLPDASGGLSSYTFFRTVKIKGYSYFWGGTLLVGVRHGGEPVNPLMASGGINEPLRLLVYDSSTFAEPLTGLPAFDAVIPLANGSRLHEGLLNYLSLCLPGDLRGWPFQESGWVGAVIKMNPYHDGSELGAPDIASLIDLSKSYRDPSAAPDLLKASKSPRILGERVEGRISAGDQVIREYRSLVASFHVGESPDCYKISRAVFTPLAPWEVSAPLKALVDVDGRPPDLVKDSGKIFSIARALAAASGREDLERRASRLGEWISRTGTAIIGNGAYYVDKALTDSRGDVVEVALSAYRREKAYWGSMGVMEGLGSMFNWGLSGLRASPRLESGAGIRIELCAETEGGDELSKILLTNRLLPVEVAVYYGKQGGARGYGELVWAGVLRLQGGQCGYTEIPRGALEILVVELSRRAGSAALGINYVEGAPAAFNSGASIAATAVVAAGALIATAVVVLRRLRRPGSS